MHRLMPGEGFPPLVMDIQCCRSAQLGRRCWEEFSSEGDWVKHLYKSTGASGSQSVFFRNGPLEDELGNYDRQHIGCIGAEFPISSS